MAKKDKYYGPEKYKGDLRIVKKKNPKLYKKYRKKYKGRYIGPDKYKGVKPTKPAKTNPAPPKYVVKTIATKNVQAQSLVKVDDQSDEMITAYLSIAGVELFQYTNAQTIDGAYNDVAIINVLSRSRQEYTPNRIIEQAEVYVVDVWVNDGRLYFEIEGGTFNEALLTFNVLGDLQALAETVD